MFAYRQHEGNNFEFRSAELGLSASVDPFVRGYAFFNGTSDDFEVEEAAVVTTSLPFNLAVKGGRFFADFGRLAKFHEHDLPFVNRPVSVDRFVGGESQANGVEVSYLLPIEHYVTLTAGMYNKLGAENDRVSNEVPRDLGEFTYLGRVATFISLSDAHSIDLGASYAYTPQVASEEKAHRHLAGLDITYRYVPPSQAAYRGLVWGTEVFFNRENRPVGGFPTDPTIPSPVVFERNNAWGLYTYLEARLSRRFYTGFLFDYAQALDADVGDTKAYSPYLTFWPRSSSASACSTLIGTSQASHRCQPTRTRSSCNGPSSLGAMRIASGTAKESAHEAYCIRIALRCAHAPGVPCRSGRKIRVVATIPDLADMARNIGGDLLEVKSLATGVENTHAVPMKPSFAMLLNRADVLLLMGLGLEHTFLPGLLEAARNPKILGTLRAISTAQCTLPHSKCRHASTGHWANSTPWATHISTSIRSLVRRWLGPLQTA